MSSITVLIADHEESRRNSCLRLLKSDPSVEVVGLASDGFEAIAAAAKLKPRILLVDLCLLRAAADLILSTLRRQSPWTKVILLIGRLSDNQIFDALSHGAQGYMEKADLDHFLLKAVRSVDAGNAWVPRRIVTKIVNRLTSNPA